MNLIPTLKFCYSNVNGFLSKKHAIAAYLSSSRIPVLAIVETKLGTSIGDCDLGLPKSYAVYRKDRSCGGGGICFIVAKTLSVSLCACNDSVKHEVFGIDIILRGRTIRLVVVYWPPAQYDYGAHIFSDIKLFIDTADAADVCILGDFNLPKARWSDYSCSVAVHQQFITDMYTCGFRQYINEPTRFSPPNILDLLWLKNRNLLQSFKIGAPFGSSDHVSIEVSLTGSGPRTEPKTFKNFRAIDSESVRSFLFHNN